MNVADQFLRLYHIVRKLRGPDGCPWDQKQTAQSLRSHLLEEVYETIEAVDSSNPLDVEEELGDVYLLVTMLGIIYEEDGAFTVADSLSVICEKLIRRHPHVFSDSDIPATTEEVVDLWNRIKVEEEGKRPKDLLLDAVSSALPSLERADKLQKEAAKVGFDWPNLDGVLEKLHEEIGEVQSEIAVPSPDPQAVEEEIGDLLFSAINVSRFLGVDPSIALHGANQKFCRRFGVVETELKVRGISLEDATLDQMEEIWDTLR